MTTRQQQLFSSANVHTDDEWHPHDPAFSTPMLLKGIWDQIANAGTMGQGETFTVIYPEMTDKLTPRYLNLLMAHLDSCKDVCDHFGITTTLVPYMDQKTGQVTGFTAKSFRNPQKDDELQFSYDPFWDEDDTDFEALYKGVDDEDLKKDPYPQIVNKVPDSVEEIVDITKKWVGKLMSDMGICPFTAGPETAGLPVGPVFYSVDRSSGFEEMYAAYWHEVVRLELKSEKELSTTLLIVPEFCMDNVELFESFTNTLTQPLAALEIENLIQLVFFHPHWSFRDGSARAGTGQAANYARRSPWPMINILRTSQVRTAQKGIPTGLVYKQNEKTLNSVGVDQLETMLRLRDWSEIADLKVNRKEYDALKIAQDFQAKGVVDEKDQSLAHDATPAANKVDRSLVEQGNLVNVVKQALEKRLGKDTDGTAKPLTGPETSASAMAADFLLEEFSRVAAGVSTAPAAPATDETNERKNKVVENDVQEPDDKSEKEYTETDELKRAKEARFAKARNALFDDLREAEVGNPREPMGPSSGMSDVLFGKGGIHEMRPDDESHQQGLDPGSFY